MTGTRPVVAVAGPMVPAEVIRAHGFEPVALMPLAAAGVSVSAGVCAAARGWCAAVAEAETRLAAAVLTTRCDQFRREAEALRGRVRLPVFVMNVPATHGTVVAQRLYREETQRLDDFLGKVPHDVAAVSETAWRVATVNAKPGRHRVGLLGCCLGEADTGVLAILGNAGLEIILDALEPPFETRPLIRQRPNAPFFDWLRTVGTAHSLDGWVLLRQTWCDVFRAEEPRLKQATELPWLVVETGARPALETIRTRAEAFAEQLDARRGGRA